MVPPDYTWIQKSYAYIRHAGNPNSNLIFLHISSVDSANESMIEKRSQSRDPGPELGAVQV
jgi:hypothetical protein